ncbi:hypothetical protein [Vibrio sp. D431a]|uniref:hypothetical protein n=1 Tax=Vibrio sp. D431a TaxID=2837388 RepID=UPI002555CCCD|nr:hypothetical protein [Vibrio sp. D431a]MDK9790722.1 hypothetical protein [Vibrio sp. D431a]
MAVKELKALRREFRRGEIKSEDELYDRISTFFCETKSGRYALAALLFAENKGIVQRIQKDKFSHSANSLKARYLSDEGLRTIDVREYFEIAKQGDHIIKRAKTILGVHFEDFENKCKVLMSEWIRERLLKNYSLYEMRNNFRGYYKDSYYLSFFESVFDKELKKRNFGNLMEDI